MKVLLRVKKHKHIISIVLVVGLISAVVWAIAERTMTPEPSLAPSQPQSSLFFELPRHKVGESVEANGYKIKITRVQIEDSKLAIDIALENRSTFDVDLTWAIQLRDGRGWLIRPMATGIKAQGRLLGGDTLTNTWQYDLGVSAASLNELYLIYAPRGWSGPVIVFRLD